jgi:hypothetical protein
MKHDTRRIRSSDVDAVQSREGSEGRYARRGCLGRASGGVQRSGCVRLAACVRTEEMVVKAPWCEADTPVWVEIEIMSAPRRRGAASLISPSSPRAADGSGSRGHRSPGAGELTVPGQDHTSPQQGA